ncbi:hypothetical protein I3842_04G125000 [Carya illinoinensis]|uniref:Protein FAR1-RELATED SEQUENCE n=1 Tax=Carya illinoinensis TaxID=32201 RepID=A0A922FCH2_CARIL|nr:hypothetical protein I3842_04G125000 [Carya illinoinensis]
MSSSYVEPYVGLEFDDIENALSCYKAFSRQTGFSIRTNHTRLSAIDKSLIGVDYVCSREGFRRYNLKLKERARPEAPETKCGCKAMMAIKKKESKWVVSKFVLQHNHELRSGIPTQKIMSVLSKEHGGDYNIGCIPKDIQNYLGNGRKQLLEEGDAQKLYEYFLESELDGYGLMENCFWADDVVTFDATYLTNRYKMPFVPFTGVNHHHQSTAESYTWLLKTWLEVMLGHAPSTIITDDDKSMAKAITEVLPNTTHKLSHVYNKYPQFKYDFNHCIHDTLTIEEFELEWTKMLLKEKWVPAYLRSIFCVGMSTTQRSESMNNEFVHQYEKALNARYLSEKLKDVKTKTSRPIMKTCLSIEEALANLYTRKSFLIFQEELFSSQRFKSHKAREQDERKIYLVAIPGREKPAYEVTLENDKNVVSCTCLKFEFIGFLCRHILHILTRKNCLDLVLQSYVLERWTVNAKSRMVQGICVDEGPLETIPIAFIKKHRLMRQFYIVAEMGSLSMNKYEHVSRGVETIHQELLLMSDDDGGGGNTEGHAIQRQTISNFSLQDPPIIVSKGRPKTLQQKNPKENVPTKKRRCSICKQEGHVRTKCPTQRYLQ